MGIEDIPLLEDLERLLCAPINIPHLQSFLTAEMCDTHMLLDWFVIILLHIDPHNLCFSQRRCHDVTLAIQKQQGHARQRSQMCL